MVLNGSEWFLRVLNADVNFLSMSISYEKTVVLNGS